VVEDARGSFVERYTRSEFLHAGITDVFVQDNSPHSGPNVLRGFPYQKTPNAQGTMVSVIIGGIFDVAVDLRRGSPTFGRWTSATLSANNHRVLSIPVGFAHGFCVRGDRAIVCYKVTAECAPDLDRGILWHDPDLGIEWPVRRPVLSPRDPQFPTFRDADNDFVDASRRRGSPQSPILGS
jgi:dTDP-4-dehydrorhamnose 3,5-epimerase